MVNVMGRRPGPASFIVLLRHPPHGQGDAYDGKSADSKRHPSGPSHSGSTPKGHVHVDEIISR
jgi:hypothetical protein